MTTEREFPYYKVGKWLQRWPGDDLWYAYRQSGIGPANTKRCGHVHRSVAAAEKCAEKMRLKDVLQGMK